MFKLNVSRLSRENKNEKLIIQATVYWNKNNTYVYL